MTDCLGGRLLRGARRGRGAADRAGEPIRSFINQSIEACLSVTVRLTRLSQQECGSTRAHTRRAVGSGKPPTRGVAVTGSEAARHTLRAAREVARLQQARLQERFLAACSVVRGGAKDIILRENLRALEARYAQPG